MTGKPSGLSLTNSKGAQNHRALDYYPTPGNVTTALMEFLDLARDMEIWEPACGDGAMSRALEKYAKKVISTEIRNDGGYGLGGVDFLETTELLAPVVITNPPFNASEDFIRHAIGDLNAEVVCLLLKSQYWHSSKRLQLFREFTPRYVLPLTWRPDFLPQEMIEKIEAEKGGRKSSPTMEVAWSVWMAPHYEVTEYIPLQKPVKDNN